MTVKHLAQVNIAEQRFPNEAPEMADFMGALDAINALAERSAGFVWRLKDDAGHAMDLRFDATPGAEILVNMSVWESIETLRTYVYTTAHANIMARRAKWFPQMKTAHMALWWVDAGSTPRIADAQRAIASLDEHGPTSAAFTFDTLFDAEGAPIALPPINKLCA